MIYWIIGFAGAIGSLLRYSVGKVFPAVEFWGFPIGTLLANYMGSFFLSWFSVWSVKRKSVPSWVQAGVITGLIGSFTTFSTFSVEVIELMVAGWWRVALLYVLLSLWGGLILAWSGYQLAIKRKRG